MQTKLSLFCDRIIEACWLAAVVVVPLFFNVYSSRVFEPDKLSLLRSIALVMIAAWLTKSVEGWRSTEGRSVRELGQRALRFLRFPLALPTVIMVAVYVLTTVTSVVPRVSFWGSYQRMQGTYTFLSYVVVFLLMLNTLRLRQQLNRLLTVIIVTSFPIALYGIIQHFQLDPLPWRGDVTARVASNMGNAIFVAAYLIMVVPLTVGRFISAVQSYEEGDTGRDMERQNGPRLASIAGVGLLLALEVLCLAYIFLYQLFFLSNVDYVAGGPIYYLLLASSLTAAVSIVVLCVFLSKTVARSATARTAHRVMLFAGQSLALSYFLLLIFKLNYVVLSGSVVAEFVSLAGVMLVLVTAFWFSFREEATLPQLLAALYGFILVIELMCIFFTKSRGPWLGLLAGLFVFIFILGVRRRITWLWSGATGVAVAGMLFLAALNVPHSPLASFRNIPYVGRLGSVLETDTGTGKVRVLIWEGVLNLIGRHEAIGLPPEYVDGLNILRPLIGYGPESMYVAYNRFYPPDLAHYEARNASPDRSHNETFDALATTGWLGFFAYIFLFGSLFYYGLKWLGFATNHMQRLIYIALWASGGFLFAVGARLLDGTWRFSGVALAVGITVGFLAYLVIHAFLLSRGEAHEPGICFTDQILLIALFSAIVAHFIEIHFGIAIAATRTYFWVYAALLVVTGLSLWQESTVEPAAQAVSDSSRSPEGQGRKRQRHRSRRRAEVGVSRLLRWAGASELIALSIVMGLIMATLGFDLITGGFDPSAKGFSVVWLLALTWLVGGAVIMFEGRHESEASIPLSLALYVLISLGIFVVFGALHYATVSYQPQLANIDDLLRQGQRIANVIVLYYVGLFALIALAALALTVELRSRRPLGSWPSLAVCIVLLITVCGLILVTNVNAVRADIYYKQGLTWDESQQWDASMALYKESMRLAPDQDWYYLFMARAILEKVKTLSENAGGTLIQPQSVDDFLSLSPQQVAGLSVDSLFRSAFVVLTAARDINPLNTDHSANLGRMFRMWMTSSTGLQERQERLERSVAYYRDATTLSPHNAQLFNEWGLVYAVAGRYEEAVAKYEESLALDKQYADTYVLLGDAYSMWGKPEAAIEVYKEALEVSPAELTAHSQLCALLAQQGHPEEAVAHCEKAAELSPKSYQVHRNLAIVYRELGRLEDAVAQAVLARDLATEEEKPAWDSFIAELQESNQ